MGLHNITGQKLPVQMLSRLGHSVDCNTVCEIETGLAETVLQNAETNPLKLKPTEENAIVPTVFWADNFNAKHYLHGRISRANLCSCGKMRAFLATKK